MLDFTAFEKAVTSLKTALEEYQKTKSVFVRDAAIQRFEYTYELSHKMLRRYLSSIDPNPNAVLTMSFQNLIRLGSKQNLLCSGWDVWKDYRALRGATSHTYDELKANQVFQEIPKFYQEAKYLLGKLKANPTQ